MTKRHRRHSTAKKRQVVEEYLAGEALHAVSKRHDVCRNLIRIWIEKYERGEYDDDAVEADLFLKYEARIAALERLAGRQALEIEFLIGAQSTVRSCPKRTAPAGRRRVFHAGAGGFVCVGRSENSQRTDTPHRRAYGTECDRYG